MFPRIGLIPRVTTSRKELISHIMKICEVYELEEKDDFWIERIKFWVKRIEECVCDAHYFEGLIFVDKLAPYPILHELVHHVSRVLKYLTESTMWYGLDCLVDNIDIVIFKKGKE